ncbi:zinc finger protein 521-like [Cylas formicarius]|uniref:zinc finger protein 521-like n=1 Tax=Cylas formicarius TaxID=197179 RepID=UPI002958B5B3|nr:zinc finger protein 521-like [Cylas formicarius]
MDIKSEIVIKDENLLNVKSEQNDEIIFIDSSDEETSATSSNTDVDVEDKITSTYIIYKEPLQQQENKVDYFFCVVCLLGFTDNQKLESHLTEAHFFIKTIYVCPNCLESHTSKDDFQTHLMQHALPYSNDFMAFECNYCNLSNGSRVGMLAHVEQHFRKAKRQMDQASRFSKTIESLKRNVKTMRTRHGWASRQQQKRPPFCRVCCKRVYRLREHVKAVHSATLACFVCHAPVTKLEKHLRKEHFYSRPIHSCPLCPDTFEVRKSFVAHLQSAHRFSYRDTYTTYMCVHCGGVTSDHRSAAEHANRHFREAGVEPTDGGGPVGPGTCKHCLETVAGDGLRCRGPCGGSYHLNCSTGLAEELFDVDNENWFCVECRGSDANEAFGVINDIANTSRSMDVATNDYRREAKRVKRMRDLTDSIKEDHAKLENDMERIDNFIRNAKSDRINNKLTRTVCNIVRNLLHQSD